MIPTARVSRAWAATLRTERLVDASVPIGRAAVRVGEQAIGTPYVANTLEAYLRDGGSASSTEPLTLSLTRFDCVTLVESCLAVARVARAGGTPTWDRFAREVERMRYRDGTRGDYASRLHYFSDWIADGERRGLLRDMGDTLGGVKDDRPLRFMSEHRGSYAALADDGILKAIAAAERRLDGRPRRVIPTARIAAVSRSHRDRRRAGVRDVDPRIGRVAFRARVPRREGSAAGAARAALRWERRGDQVDAAGVRRGDPSRDGDTRGAAGLAARQLYVSAGPAVVAKHRGVCAGGRVPRPAVTAWR